MKVLYVAKLVILCLSLMCIGLFSERPESVVD
jgi:hypothetical protein